MTPPMIGTQNKVVVDALCDAGDALAAALFTILDVYEIDAKLGKTAGNKALKAWAALRAEIAPEDEAEGEGEEGEAAAEREPGDLPCPATGDAHDATATPTRWFNRCGACGEAWPG